MRILLATGIYPPHIGGPAQYVYSLKKELEAKGHAPKVITYTVERFLPVGIRHVFFFCKTIFFGFFTDRIIAFDTFSTGVPALLAGALLRKKTLIRIGGDFLWESYVERTKEPILLSEFYHTQKKYTIKEKSIFLLTKWALSLATRIVFSTSWQRDIFLSPYTIPIVKTVVIENRYARCVDIQVPTTKIFLFTVRNIALKNKERTIRAFEAIQREHHGIILDMRTRSHDELEKAIQSCYAVLLPSFSEVSPNFVMDAVSFGKPFVLTKDNGVMNRLNSMGVFVDPKDEEAIASGIRALLDPKIYNTFVSEIKKSSFSHTTSDIASEFLSLLS